MKKKIDLSILAESWGRPFVARNQLEKFTGGMVTPASMAVFDCQGNGPDGRILVNRKIVYPVNSIVAWLESRASEV